VCYKTHASNRPSPSPYPVPRAYLVTDRADAPPDASPVRSICVIDASAVEREADRVPRLPLPLAEGAHELLELSSALDFEKTARCCR
jgi:hypothetical protein